MPAIKSMEELKRIREEALQKKKLKAMLFNQIRNIVGGQTHVVNTFRVHHHLGAASTAPNARSLQHLNFVDQALCNKFIL